MLETSKFVYLLVAWRDAWLSRRLTGWWSRDQFLHFWAQAISLERINLYISNLVCRLNVNSTGSNNVKVLRYGMYLWSRDLLQFLEISALSLVNRRFEAKRTKYCKFHIIQTTASILNKFGRHNDRDHQVVIVGGPNSRPTNPRWRTAAIMKKPLNIHVSASVWPILMKFGTVTHIGPLQGIVRKNIEFLKIQDGGGRHLENHRNRDISATVWPIFTKFGMMVQNGSLNLSDR